MEVMFSSGRNDLCGMEIVISKYLRTEMSDCDDKLAGAPSAVWLKLGVGGCTPPREFATHSLIAASGL